MDPAIQIRLARPEDAPALLDIYRPYVETTAISFEYQVPSLAEFTQRICKVTETYPYLVAEAAGEILGYAYATSFHPRAAYGWTAETSIYIKAEKKGLGIGGRLYRALDRCLLAQGVRNLIACVAWPEQEDEYLTWDSAAFHQRMGYRRAGELHRCGFKFGRWYNMLYLEKALGGHPVELEPVLPFPQVRDQLELDGD